VVDKNVISHLVDAVEKQKETKHLLTSENGGGPCNAHYGYLKKQVEGTYVASHWRWACHARMASAGAGADGVYSFYLNSPHCPAEHYEMWLDYITDRTLSPWRMLWTLEEPIEVRPGVHHTDKEYIKELNAFTFYSLTKIPANLLVSFLIASRQPRQHGDLINQWAEYCKMGFHPTVAIMLVSCMYQPERLPNATPATKSPTMTKSQELTVVNMKWALGDFPFINSLTFAEIGNVLNGTPRFLLQPYKQSAQYSPGIYRMWSERPGPTFDRDHTSAFADYVHELFGCKNKVSPKPIPYKEFVKSAAETNAALIKRITGHYAEQEKQRVAAG
jgi:hypothetical protein